MIYYIYVYYICIFDLCPLFWHRAPKTIGIPYMLRLTEVSFILLM